MNTQLHIGYVLMLMGFSTYVGAFTTWRRMRKQRWVPKRKRASILTRTGREIGHKVRWVVAWGEEWLWSLAYANPPQPRAHPNSIAGPFPGGNLPNWEDTGEEFYTPPARTPEGLDERLPFAVMAGRSTVHRTDCVMLKDRTKVRVIWAWTTEAVTEIAENDGLTGCKVCKPFEMEEHSEVS